jgi:alpha-L-fucosidase
MMMMMMMMRSLLVVVAVTVVHFLVAAAVVLTLTTAAKLQAKQEEENESGSDDVSQQYQQQQQQQQQQQRQQQPQSPPIPSWDDLDKLPLADWYSNAKFGIFIHWGVFSVPAIGEWFEFYWQSDHSAYGDQYRHFVQQSERPNFAYADYAHRFTAQLFQPDDWANVFAKAGAQYVVLTSKHHDGFCNWDSRDAIPTTWNWNAMDIGPRRDLVGELAAAIRNVTSPHTKRQIKFGLYHSLYEWFNPLYLQDKKNNYTTRHFVDQKTLPELYDLVHKYQPDLIWSDGEWEAPSSYWQATEFLHWYATESAAKDTAVWNDRWGSDVRCHHGAYFTCDDRYNPGGYDPNTNPKKWENAMTIDKTAWGYNRNASYSDYMTATEIIHTLIQVVAWNGNLLLNIGPAADGTIPAIFVDRLLHVGDWLQVNGRAIYDTVPWRTCQNESATGVYYTTTRTSDDDSNSKSSLFVHMTKWPSNNVLSLQCPQPTADTRITMLGLNETTTTTTTTSSSTQHTISWSFWSEPKTSTTASSSATTRRLPSKEDVTVGSNTLVIQLPALTPDIIPCQHAWVLELSHIANL